MKTMLFSVGYQLRASSDWMDAILRSKTHIAEVYFAFPGFANGRSALSSWQEEEQCRKELRLLAQNGIQTNLLFNAMCYGDESQSRAFFNRVGETVDYCQSRLGTTSVTTTSPLIGKFIHANFEGLPVRASVNMGVGSVSAMRPVAEYFDGFYLKREWNRHPEEIEKMKNWCDDTGHTLHLLANSGCIRDCAMHTFHDNLVAHERGIAQMDNAYAFEPVCRAHLKEHPEDYLSLATFIRPEDLHLYEAWFSTAKLATRVSRDPVRILESYIAGHFRGSLPSLTEPDHEGCFAPDILENSLLPQDFGRHVMECAKDCAHCDYCKNAFTQARIPMNGDDLLC